MHQPCHSFRPTKTAPGKRTCMSYFTTSANAFAPSAPMGLYDSSSVRSDSLPFSAAAVGDREALGRRVGVGKAGSSVACVAACPLYCNTLNQLQLFNPSRTLTCQRLGSVLADVVAAHVQQLEAVLAGDGRRNLQEQGAEYECGGGREG